VTVELITVSVADGFQDLACVANNDQVQEFVTDRNLRTRQAGEIKRLGDRWSSAPNGEADAVSRATPKPRVSHHLPTDP